MKEIAVETEELTKKFGNFTAVDHITFKVQKGEVFGFLGPNGAGKSTTIKMLCGLITPSSGKGLVGGYDINRESEKIKNIIGYMSQKFSLYQDLTVEENIRFYSGIYNIKRAERQKRLEWILEMAGLLEKRETLTGELALGWKQRLALGCAIIHKPRILFLDEPTSGVDPIARRNFWDFIYELSGKGVTIFVTTHYMDEAEYCDRVSLMYGGKIIALGSPSELKEKYFPYNIYSLECKDAVLTLPELKKISFIAGASLFGNSIHIVLKDLTITKEILEKVFLERAINIQSLQKITPTLEDVFIWLIEKYNQSYA